MHKTTTNCEKGRKDEPVFKCSLFTHRAVLYGYFSQVCPHCHPIHVLAIKNKDNNKRHLWLRWIRRLKKLAQLFLLQIPSDWNKRFIIFAIMFIRTQIDSSSYFFESRFIETTYNLHECILFCCNSYCIFQVLPLKKYGGLLWVSVCDLFRSSYLSPHRSAVSHVSRTFSCALPRRK